MIVLILGYLGALVIGTILGLIGGGGSILTVPVLVYIMSIHPVTATAYSLFVVGTSSSVGALKNIQKGTVNYKTAFLFAIPAVIAVFCTRRFLLPALPEILYFGFSLSKANFIMLFFAVLMLFASFSMILDQKREIKNSSETNQIKYFWLFFLGLGTGLITGLVGAGGGFIIIPILVILARLPMKKAIGTSLFIIAINSLLGFLGDLSLKKLDWAFLLSFSFVAILGIFLGTYLSNFIDGKKLKKAFGWFVLLMGSYILYKEIFF